MSLVDPRIGPLATDEGRPLSAGALVGVIVAHTVVWIGLARGIPGDAFMTYPQVGSSTTPWLRQVIIPLAVVLVLQIALISGVGWWRSIWRDRSRSEHRLLWVPPALVLSAAVGLVMGSGPPPTDLGYLLGLSLAMVMVGLSEELTFRGIAVVGGRRLLRSEVQVALLTSAAFGLFHLPNVILGATLAEAGTQAVLTAVFGLAIYGLRRAAGLLWPCVLLHAVYDWLVISANY